MVLQYDIGLNCPTFRGLGTLGNKLIKVAFSCFNNFPFLKNYSTASLTSSPTMFHALLKKLLPNPSGPELLFTLIVIIDILNILP